MLPYYITELSYYFKLSLYYQSINVADIILYYMSYTLVHNNIIITTIVGYENRWLSYAKNK